MSTFLYYLPGQTVGTVGRDKVREVGLGEIFRDCLTTQLAFQQRVIAHQVHANGPGPIKSGVILVAQPGESGEVTQKIGYYPSEQTWVDCKSFWLGWETAKRPTPDGLRRSPFVPGYEVMLADGHIWTAPTIRRGGRAPALPASLGIDEAGSVVTRILPEFDWAWQVGQEIFDRVFGPPTLAWDIAYRLCVEALSLNYRVGPREVSELRILTTENFQRIFDAAVDWDLVQELLSEGEPEKKNTGSVAGPSSTSPGAADGSPNTVPVGASSPS